MPGSLPDKLIVTNLDKLTLKYGATGGAKIRTAVRRLIAADATRGILTVLVDLSDAATMATYGLPPIPAAMAGSASLNKQAVDAVYTHGDVRPAYLMLLGSTDVIPHVPLVNPMAGDGDPDLPSDLPYASDNPFSTDVQDFIAPTRVVGRLPNVTNDTKPAYLVGLLDTAATYAGRPASAYSPFLGISAQVWRTSTELSLDAVFGTHAGMKISPPDGHKWTAAEAKPLSHFVNCHGVAGDPNFYGEKAGVFPVAHSAAWMASKVAAGTVIAAECCYGAELYDPALPTAGGQMGMCNTYLGREAYAYFGSTNIAYGPAAANDLADLICQFFLLHLASSASAGRACLQARLDYVLRKGGLLTPVDLKTLGQFTLMGDPSLTPVAAPTPHAVSVPVAKATPRVAGAAVARHERRGRRAGLATQAAAVVAHRLVEAAGAPVAGKGVLTKLRKLAAEHGIKAPDIMISYAVGAPAQRLGAKALAPHVAAAGPGPAAVHTLLQRLEPPKKLPHLALVRGLQAVEYADGMSAEVFESR